MPSWGTNKSHLPLPPPTPTANGTVRLAGGKWPAAVWCSPDRAGDVCAHFHTYTHTHTHARTHTTIHKHPSIPPSSDTHKQTYFDTFSHQNPPIHTRTWPIKALPYQLHSNGLQQQELTEISNSALYDTVHQDEWHCIKRTRHQMFITVDFLMGLVGRQSHWTSAYPEISHFEDGVQDIGWELNKQTKTAEGFFFSSLHQYSSQIIGFFSCYIVMTERWEFWVWALESGDYLSYISVVTVSTRSWALIGCRN